ncbi:phage minor head protein [Falsiroseomonas sp.]|uniref:phage minor head protein n=1 Tax=Falsiroseomonas sp. TaxID=2870721 RepID=UPI003F72C1DA
MSRETLAAINLPPAEAIRFLAGKANVTTQHWTDVWRDGHSRAFMVAGAATQALVQDFRDAVAKALEQGTTLAEFRRDFDGIVGRHGWVHNGTAAWRSRLIYDVNLSMAYGAGRWAQQTNPDVLAAFPYLQYVHSGAVHPRKQHKAWDGLVLRADDGFWATHYPPNGWRCGCRARSRSARDLARMGKAAPDAAPRIETRSWTNPRTGVTSQVPEGIDPGFDYNPGQAFAGGRLPEIPGTATLQVPDGWMPPPPPLPAATAVAPPPSVSVAPVAPMPSVAIARASERLREEFAPWGSGLTAGEAAALDAYKGVAGRAMNAALRGEIDAEAVPPGMIAELSEALGRAVMPRRVVAYRGGGDADAALLAGKRPGDTVQFPWFLSSSIDAAVARSFAQQGGGPSIELRLSAGLRGVAYVHPFPRYRYRQFEFLASPGLLWRIVRRTPSRIVLEPVERS